MDRRAGDHLHTQPLDRRTERLPSNAGGRGPSLPVPLMRVLVFLLALFAAIQSAAAEDGRALVVTGRVMLERASPGAFSNTAVLAGSEIRRGDLIRTGNDGRVQIRFSD